MGIGEWSGRPACSASQVPQPSRPRAGGRPDLRVGGSSRISLAGGCDRFRPAPHHEPGTSPRAVAPRSPGDASNRLPGGPNATRPAASNRHGAVSLAVGRLPAPSRVPEPTASGPAVDQIFVLAVVAPRRALRGQCLSLLCRAGKPRSHDAGRAASELPAAIFCVRAAPAAHGHRPGGGLSLRPDGFLAKPGASGTRGSSFMVQANGSSEVDPEPPDQGALLRTPSSRRSRLFVASPRRGWPDLRFQRPSVSTWNVRQTRTKTVRRRAPRSTCGCQ